MTQKIKIRTAYDDSYVDAGLICPETTETQQQFRDEADINKIMAQWQKTGTLTHVNEYQGEYADLSSYSDNYHENLNTIIEAQNMFMSLPSSIRDDFKNDPGAFLDFVGNPDNKEKMAEYGLLKNNEISSPSNTASEISSVEPTAPTKAASKAAKNPSNGGSISVNNDSNADA